MHYKRVMIMVTTKYVFLNFYVVPFYKIVGFFISVNEGFKVKTSKFLINNKKNKKGFFFGVIRNIKF